MWFHVPSSDNLGRSHWILITVAPATVKFHDKEFPLRAPKHKLLTVNGIEQELFYYLCDFWDRNIRANSLRNGKGQGGQLSHVGSLGRHSQFVSGNSLQLTVRFRIRVSTVVIDWKGNWNIRDQKSTSPGTFPETYRRGQLPQSYPCPKSKTRVDPVVNKAVFSISRTQNNFQEHVYF